MKTMLNATYFLLLAMFNQQLGFEWIAMVSMMLSTALVVKDVISWSKKSREC